MRLRVNFGVKTVRYHPEKLSANKRIFPRNAGTSGSSPDSLPSWAPEARTSWGPCHRRVPFVTSL